jgi:hypothetical protein
MIGIYQDNIIDYFKEFSPSVKVTSKNLILACPWCEYNLKKPHYHLYISLEAPIFHCFEGACNQSGMISKLFKKLNGKDSSDNYIDKEKIKESVSKDIKLSTPVERKKLFLPDLKMDSFKLKTLYLKGRLKYSVQDLSTINGIIFDVDKFISDNQIRLDNRLLRVKDYLQSNFIGFLTEKESVVVFRNIDESQEFRYFKLFLYETKFLDYYKIPGPNYFSNHIVISEGIFDIYNEHIFDYTGLRKDIKIYAAGLSTSYDSLIKSIVFNEKIYRLNVSVLSDRGIELDFYKKIKRYNSHIIDKMTVYYNKVAKDFGDSSVIVEKFIL